MQTEDRNRFSISRFTCRALLALLIAAGCSSTSMTAPEIEPRSAGEPTHAPWRYALVINASNSASSLQVYQWRPRSGQRLPQIETAPFPREPGGEIWEMKVRPGLSSHAGDPEAAVRSLEPLIGFALDKIGDDPETRRRTTLLLRATAGMRLLTEEQRSEIMSAVRAYVDTLSLAASSARVISGDEEGIYGWIAVNYLLGHLEHGGPFPTVGALDLGGASTQITFVPLDYPKRHGQPVRVGGNTYHLYTHSYLGLGQDSARITVGSPACFIKGYPLPRGAQGSGRFEECRQAIRDAFAAPCDAEPCSLFGAYQPPVYGEFLAFSVYAYAADFFDLEQRLEPDDLAERGAHFCAQDWDSMVAASPELVDDPYTPNYCFAAAHITTLLTDGFGFSGDTERVTAPMRVQGSSVGWALGALVFELAGSVD